MARKRLISPEFFMHEALYETEARLGLPIRVAFAGLWTQADRRGVFRWRAKQLKLAILPYDPVDFEAVLEGLLNAGFIRRYVVDGEAYGHVVSFQRWQTFHHAERPSDAPSPEGDPRPTPARPESNPTVAVAVAVTGSVTNAVAVGRAAGPEGPPPPAAKRGGAMMSLADFDWRSSFEANGAKRPARPIGFQAERES